MAKYTAIGRHFKESGNVIEREPIESSWSGHLFSAFFDVFSFSSFRVEEAHR
jgi:hypothetical protein